MSQLALTEPTLLSCRLTPMLLSPVLTFFNPIRGLLVMDSGWGPLCTEQCVCIYSTCTSIFFFFLERRGLQTLPVSWPTSVSQFWSSWGLPGDHRGLPHVTDLSDCVLSLLNVRWKSSCRHYSSTYLMCVNNVFKEESDWMLVLWDHRSERSLTRWAERTRIGKKTDEQY